MDDLIAFLRARYDEDERLAHAAETRLVLGFVEIRTPEIDAAEAHIDRWASARVLAEVDAKRRILDRFEFTNGHGPARDDVRAMDMTTGALAALRDVVRLAALPYADHPDYRTEWQV